MYTDKHILAVIGRLTWHDVKSPHYVERMPHQWCERKSADPAAYQALVTAIRDHGVTEYFRGRSRKYLYAGQHRYWSMGTIINRMLTRDLGKLAPELRVYRSLADWRAGTDPILG